MAVNKNSSSLLNQSGAGSSSPGSPAPDDDKYKTKIPNNEISKVKNDVPSWAKGEKPKVGESGKQFAERVLNEKYGIGNWNRGAGSEFSKIQKWGDTHFK